MANLFSRRNHFKIFCIRLLKLGFCRSNKNHCFLKDLFLISFQIFYQQQIAAEYEKLSRNSGMIHCISRIFRQVQNEIRTTIVVEKERGSKKIQEGVITCYVGHKRLFLTYPTPCHNSQNFNQFFITTFKYLNDNKERHSKKQTVK